MIKEKKYEIFITKMRKVFNNSFDPDFCIELDEIQKKQEQELKIIERFEKLKRIIEDE